jgi:hypothetical protein
MRTTSKTSSIAIAVGLTVFEVLLKTTRNCEVVLVVDDCL